MLFGSGLLTPSIQTAAASLLAGTTPTEWSSVWEGPEKPQAWLSELVRKRIALTRWLASSARGNLLDEALSLGDLFNPATFVNALRQQTARLLGSAIDRVKMICSWANRKDALQAFSKCGNCPLPCQLTSLLLQGASFSAGGSALRDSASEASELTPAPNVMIGFIDREAGEPYGEQPTIAIPVYFTPSREEYLTELQIPVEDNDKNKWILAGVSLFLSEGD